MFDKNLSQRYKESYESGNTEALFEYAEINRFFLHQQWVRDKLQLWLLRPDRNVKKWINRLLFGDKSGRRNETNPAGLQRIVERDKRIFIDMIRLRQKGYPLTGSSSSKKVVDTQSRSIFSKLAKKYNVGEESIRDVYKYYNKFYKEQAKLIDEETDRALRRMINKFYGRFPFNRYKYTPRFILRDSLQKQTKKIKRTKSEIYLECRRLLKIYKDPRLSKAQIEYNFETSILQNDFHRWWRGTISRYYPWGFTEEGFIRFLRDCKIILEGNRYFLPYQWAIQNLVEVIYRMSSNPTEEEFINELEDMNINGFFDVMGLLPKVNKMRLGR
ncbi:MAG: hypothetical protein WBW71_16070 [Bacteroidota bacterium]